MSHIYPVLVNIVDAFARDILKIREDASRDLAQLLVGSTRW